MSLVATRFAPSPTGPLHIGGVRTALFNWLFSKNNKGKFYLRIEDTDKERSKDEFKNQIIKSLEWIGIQHDGEEYIQSKKISKHQEIAHELLKKGFAYKCYCSEKEIQKQKEKAKKNSIPFVYNRKWRDAKELKIPENIDPVIRFKSKISGNSIVKDLVQGKISISNATIEDFEKDCRVGSSSLTEGSSSNFLFVNSIIFCKVVIWAKKISLTNSSSNNDLNKWISSTI